MDKFPWKLWLTTAEKHHLRIDNWPRDLPPPDSKFDFKGLDASALHLLVHPFQTNHDNPDAAVLEARIVRWTNGTGCLLSPLMMSYLFCDVTR
jgi:hypothetical protein